MGPCDFCLRPAERRLWGRRWPLREGRRQREGVEDVRVALCGEHLGQRLRMGRLLVKGGWAYG